MNEAIEVLEAEGATVVDPTRIVIEDVFGPEFLALLCEFKDDIAAYLETYTGPGYPKTLEDLIDFNDANPDLEGPWNSQIVPRRAGDGRPGGSRLPGRARIRDGVRQGRHRRRDGGARSRRDHRPDQRTGLVDRPGQR